eukprot:1193071-Prorocentrum_minimum.AAC.1
MRGNGVEQLPRVQWRKRARSRDDYAQTSAICSVLSDAADGRSSQSYPVPSPILEGRRWTLRAKRSRSSGRAASAA